jgi:hypothetical protein
MENSWVDAINKLIADKQFTHQSNQLCLFQ